MAARIPGLALGLLATAAVACQAQTDSSAFTRVITGETLRKAGVIRLAEMLRLVDDWDAATQDEFVWSAIPAGETPSAAPRWLVLVDGHRLELDVLGSLSLARVPVPLESIDRVEFERTASFAAGQLATAGIIQIRTREPRAGFSASGWATTGSEIGDPGPFAFTPLATPNVDRIGNDGSGRISYREDSWFAEGAVQVGKQNSTDPAVFDRLAAASFEEGRVRSTVVAPTVRAGLRLAGSTHTLAVRYSRAREYLPIEPVAGELAATERYAQITLDGRFGDYAPRGVRYYASWARNRAEQRRASLPIPFDWEAVTLTAGIEGAALLDGGRATLGIRGRRVAAEAPQPITDDRITIGALYGGVALGSRKLGAPHLSGELSVGDGELGIAAALRQRWEPTTRMTIEIAASASHPLKADDNSIWAWAERGYPLLAESGVPATTAGALRRPTRIAIDAGFGFAPIQSIRLRVEALFRRQRGLALPHRELQQDPVTRSFIGPGFLVVDGSGEMIGGVLSAEARWRRLTTRVAYRYQRPAGGDNSFRAAQATLPRHTIHYTVEGSPVAGIELWSMLEYQSATRWSDFESVEASTAGAILARVPAFVGLDLAVQKWFWKRRLRAHLGFRNVFGSTLRYHPAGSTLGPRMYVQFEAQAP